MPLRRVHDVCVFNNQSLVFSKENAGKKEGNHFTPTLVLPPSRGRKFRKGWIHTFVGIITVKKIMHT
jgi:hypothetical protein